MYLSRFCFGCKSLVLLEALFRCFSYKQLSLYSREDTRNISLSQVTWSCHSATESLLKVV